MNDLSGPAVGGKSLLMRSVKTGTSSGSDGLAVAVVLVVGGDVADALAQHSRLGYTTPLEVATDYRLNRLFAA